MRSLAGDSGRDSIVSDLPREATAPEEKETKETEEAEAEEAEGSGGFLQSAMEEWEYSRGYLVYKAVPCRLVD